MEKRYYFYASSLLVFVVILTLIIAPIGRCETCDIQKLEKTSPEEWLELSSKEDVVILDIRTPEEYNQGHIEGAVNIDFYSDDFSNQLDELDKTKTYLTYCRSGRRSGLSLETMRDLGFLEVYDLNGGINALD